MLKNSSRLNSIGENSDDSDNDSDNEFYSQYVQGTTPRNFCGTHANGQGTGVPISVSVTHHDTHKNEDPDATQDPGNAERVNV